MQRKEAIIYQVKGCSLFKKKNRWVNICLFKALEDEGADQENLQIQLPADATPKKSGRAKGKYL